MSAAIAGGFLVAAGTAYAANRQGAATDKQVGSMNSANALSERQTQQARTDNEPWRVTGAGAQNMLGRLFGLPTVTPGQAAAQQDVKIGDTYLPAGTTTTGGQGGWYEVLNGGNRIGTLRPGGPSGQFLNDQGVDINALRLQQEQQQAAANPQAGPDMSAFTASPGYQFRRDEGTRDVANAFGSSGGAFSGNALKALAEFNSGLASQEFGNFVGQLNTIAGNGQQATSENNMLGANAANAQGRNALYAGDARASGIENTANIIGSGLNQLGGMAGYYKKKPNLSGSSWTSQATAAGVS